MFTSPFTRDLNLTIPRRRAHSDPRCTILPGNTSNCSLKTMQYIDWDLLILTHKKKHKKLEKNLMSSVIYWKSNYGWCLLLKMSARSAHYAKHGSSATRSLGWHRRNQLHRVKWKQNLSSLHGVSGVSSIIHAVPKSSLMNLYSNQEHHNRAITINVFQLKN